MPLNLKKNRRKSNENGPPVGLDTGSSSAINNPTRDTSTPPNIDLSNSDSVSTDLWKQDIKDKTYQAKPDRPRREYDYSKYSPITIKKLTSVLDQNAKDQLLTILQICKLDTYPQNKPLNTRRIKKIIENWETLYLNKSMQIIKTSLDPLTAKDVSGKGNSLKAIPLIKEANNKLQLPKNQKEITSYISRLLANPSYESILYAKDNSGKIAALAFSLSLRPRENNDWIFNFLHQSIRRYNTHPFKLTQMGSYMYQKYLREYMHSDLKKLIPLVIVMIIMTFYFNFRSKRGVILPTLSVLFATSWTFGLMGLLNIPITLVVNLLPPLLMAVGSSYSIHILNQYYLEHDEIHTANNKKDALQKSMQSISITVLLAAITTFIGFMTLVTNRVLSPSVFWTLCSIRDTVLHD